MDQVKELQLRVQQSRDAIIQFMRDICAIPSMESKIGPVGERIQAEMRQLGYDEVRFDRMGNTIGRIGSGPGAGDGAGRLVEIAPDQRGNRVLQVLFLLTFQGEFP